MASSYQKLIKIMEFDLDNIFSYHSANEEQLKQYEAVRSAAKTFARTVLDQCPNCADRTVAIRCIREAVMNANASIALNGKLYKDA